MRLVLLASLLATSSKQTWSDTGIQLSSNTDSQDIDLDWNTLSLDIASLSNTQSQSKTELREESHSSTSLSNLDLDLTELDFSLLATSSKQTWSDTGIQLSSNTDSQDIDLDWNTLSLDIASLSNTQSQSKTDLREESHSSTSLTGLDLDLTELDFSLLATSSKQTWSDTGIQLSSSIDSQDIDLDWNTLSLDIASLSNTQSQSKTDLREESHSSTSLTGLDLDLTELASSLLATSSKQTWSDTGIQLSSQSGLNYVDISLGALLLNTPSVSFSKTALKNGDTQENTLSVAMQENLNLNMSRADITLFTLEGEGTGLDLDLSTTLEITDDLSSLAVNKGSWSHADLAKILDDSGVSNSHLEPHDATFSNLSIGSLNLLLRGTFQNKVWTSSPLDVYVDEPSEFFGDAFTSYLDEEQGSLFDISATSGSGIFVDLDTQDINLLNLSYNSADSSKFNFNRLDLGNLGLDISMSQLNIYRAENLITGDRITYDFADFRNEYDNDRNTIFEGGITLRVGAVNTYDTLNVPSILQNNSDLPDIELSNFVYFASQIGENQWGLDGGLSNHYQNLLTIRNFFDNSFNSFLTTNSDLLTNGLRLSEEEVGYTSEDSEESEDSE